MKLLSSKTIALLCCVLSGFFAAAEEDLVPNSLREIASEKKDLKMGWNKKGAVGANVSVGSTNNVIGVQDGDTNTYGINTDFEFAYKKEQKEWRTNITYKGATSRNPTVPRFVKANDDFNLKTAYLYSFKNTKWLGPYARASATTTLFRGEDLRDKKSPVIYQIEDTEGNTTQEEQAKSTFKLTDPFRPLTTRESAGFFAKALSKKTHSLEFRVGFGALQVAADDQLTLTDDADTTDVVELSTLESYSQSGFELGMEWKLVVDEKTTITASVETLTPMGVDIEAGKECADCDSIELTDVDAGVKLNTKLYDWASLNYEFRYRRQPQLLNKDQIQQLLLVNFNYSVF